MFEVFPVARGGLGKARDQCSLPLDQPLLGGTKWPLDPLACSETFSGSFVKSLVSARR
jgi:hypothetical protein